MVTYQVYVIRDLLPGDQLAHPCPSQVLTQHEARQQAALEAKALSAHRTQLRREQRAAEAAATAAAAAHQQQVGRGSSCRAGSQFCSIDSGTW
jgi:hypothetical protein